MNHQDTIGKADSILKTAQISLAVFIIAFAAVCAFAGIGRKERYLDLSDQMQITIRRNDGSTDHYNEPYFAPVHKGETMEVTLPPVEKAGFRHAALTFSLYHCEVKVWCGNDLIYRQDPRMKGQQIGGRFYMIPLPYDYQNKTIRIVADDSENDIFSSFENVRLVPDVRSLYSLLNGKILSFMLFVTLLTGAGFAFCFFIIRSILQHHREPGFYLSLFMILITVWYLGYAKLFYVISDLDEFCANVEYPALMFAPAAMGAYMVCVIESPKWKRLIRILTDILLVYAVTASVFSFSALDLNYIDFMNVFHVLFLLMTVACITGLIADQKKRRHDQLILRNGLIISMVITGAELFRFNLFTHYGIHWKILRYELSPFALLCVIMTFVISFASRIAEDSTARMQEAALRRIAYIDPLTECPNRSALERKLDAMQNEKNYVMIFADINFLKKTNDTYGHDAGDRLIQKVAELLQKQFSDERSFFGRWGGDEFIACVPGGREEAEKRIRAFESEAGKADPAMYPYGISVSFGICASTQKNPLTVQEAIRQADNEMYRYKKAHHNSR